IVLKNNDHVAPAFRAGAPGSSKPQPPSPRFFLTIQRQPTGGTSGKSVDTRIYFWLVPKSTGPEGASGQA
ncbi:MAG: hypothetical protein U5L09_15145, partial [Bacteroidales bacterium]|nr:hypothetical protein [Bacteroidales bacterium]